MSTQYQHFGDRRAIATTDAAPDFCLGIRDGKLVLLNDAEARALREQTRGRVTSDALLSAVPLQQQIRTAQEGALTILRKAAEEMQGLITPFCGSGSTLTAEQCAAVIKLGKVWRGVAELQGTMQQADDIGGSGEADPTEPEGDSHINAAGVHVLGIGANHVSGSGAAFTSAADLQAAIDGQYDRPEHRARKEAPEAGCGTAEDVQRMMDAFYGRTGS